MDAVDEWMELDAFPEHFEITPGKRELLGEGRALAFVATDVDAAWYVDLTGDVIRWQRGNGAAAVSVRGATLTDLLLLVFRRKTLSGKGFEVAGDAGQLDFWLGHSRSGDRT